MYLLHGKLLQEPFHFCGGGPNPSSLKLSDSGQIPVSITPTIMSLSALLLFTHSDKPTKSQDLVVCSSFLLFGKTETTPSNPKKN